MNITTVEGLASSGGLSTLQDMYLEVGAVQCGFCIPGMLMASTSLLNSTPDPTTAEVREALAGNLCRCGGYTRIVEAVLRAARASRHERQGTE
jgi:aerobic-type carbon monoxide dehydrogenase small subunit (CoxS/CutS family)